MLTIQTVGKQILSGNPEKFYVFVGTEYGIKHKYLSILKQHYNDYTESESAKDLISFFSKKRLIPLQPKLYIVRYDDDFISSLSDNTSGIIQKLAIVGTIVCIYESDKDTSKLAKYLPDNTVSIDPVNPAYVVNYLSKDFPDLDANIIRSVVQMKHDYGSSYQVCASMSYADKNMASACDLATLSNTFGISDTSSDQEFKYGIAARNFNYCVNYIDRMSGSLDSLLYAMLSTMLEMEKLISNLKQNSPFKKYISCWQPSDVYNFFMAVYSELVMSRSSSYYNVYDGLVYLLSLLQTSPIQVR